MYAALCDPKIILRTFILTPFLHIDIHISGSVLRGGALPTFVTMSGEICYAGVVPTEHDYHSIACGDFPRRFFRLCLYHLPPYRTNVADYGFLLSLESITLILQTAHHNSSARIPLVPFASPCSSSMVVLPTHPYNLIDIHYFVIAIILCTQTQLSKLSPMRRAHRQLSLRWAMAARSRR